MIEDTAPIEQVAAPELNQTLAVIPENSLRPVFMNSYERYEWLMQNGCTSVEERKWLADYKNSDEYKMIYENE